MFFVKYGRMHLASYLRRMEGPKARILVIRFSSIGDIVLTTPILRALKQQLHGGAELHFLTKKKFATILEANPYLDKIHSMDKTVQEVIPELESIGFDYIIDLHNNIRSRIVKKRLKTLAFTFDKLNVKKWLWVRWGINQMPHVHVVDRYMDTLKAFDVKDDGGGLDYFIPEGKGFKENLNIQFPDGYIAFAMGGAHIGKRMDAEKIASIIADLPLPVVLLGGKEDEEAGREVVERSHGKVIHYCGVTSLHESADIIRKSRLVISGDTGLMHIASAFQKKIISLWGCTVPGLGMYPYRPAKESVMIEPHGRTKRPCSKLGNRCKYGEDHRCIQQIVNAEVVSAVVKMLNDNS